MRRTLAALTALSLCLPAVAEAQRSERERGEHTAPQAGPQAVGPQGARPQQDERRGNDGGFFGRANPNQAAPAPNRQERNFAQNRDRRDDDRDRRGNDRDGRDNDRDRRDFDRGRDFRGDRDGRDARRYFNFRGRQYSAVRGSAFHYPRGWAYRHWNRGELLPRVFLAAPYFFDYGYLGLPPPPPNYRWVRYGPDALLVNVYDERIIDVIYDAFY